jgi:predicted MFS family arabinose efflux permease
MTDKPYYAQSERQLLRSWVLGQMLSGAGWAGLFVIAIGVSLGVLYGISLLLPPESKLADPPMPQSSLTQPWDGAVQPA